MASKNNTPTNANVLKLQQLFGKSLDSDVLLAILEMHNNDTRAAAKFLQAQGSEQAYDEKQLIQNEGIPTDYPKATNVKYKISEKQKKEVSQQQKVRKEKKYRISSSKSLI